MIMFGWMVSDISEIMHGEKSSPKSKENPLPVLQKFWEGHFNIIQWKKTNNKIF